MNFYNFHVNDFRGATWHLNRLQRSIYRDLIDEYYLQEKPLTKDVAVLAHKMGCHSDEEKAALALVLGEFFTLKNGVYRHKRIDHEIKNYQYRHATPATKCNVVATQDETNATDMQHECNANTLRSRKSRTLKRLREKFGLNPDKSMTLHELEALENELLGKTATQDETNATQHATDMQRECNTENPSITNNQEPNKQSLSHAHTREVDDLTRFALPIDWLPSDNAIASLRMAGLGKDLCAYPEGLKKFRLYWSAEPAELTQTQWESKFVAALVSDKQHGRNDFLPAKTPSTELAVQAMPSHSPSKTKQSMMILQAVREKVVSGSLKTVLSPKICLAMIDGLTNLLGQGLNHPPAADVWELTLTTWANEFAARGLGDDDVARVQSAFHAAKRRATHPDNQERRFPTVADVLACLPMKLSQKQLEHKMSPDEWAEKSEKGRANAAELLKNISKNRIQAA